MSGYNDVGLDIKSRLLKCCYYYRASPLFPGQSDRSREELGRGEKCRALGEISSVVLRTWVVLVICARMMMHGLVDTWARDLSGLYMQRVDGCSSCL